MSPAAEFVLVLGLCAVYVWAFVAIAAVAIFGAFAIHDFTKDMK